MSFEDEDSKMAMPAFIEFLIGNDLNQTRNYVRFKSDRVQDLWVIHRFAFRRGFKLGVDRTCEKFYDEANKELETFREELNHE